MQKHEYKKTSINIEKNLYLMAVGEGIELTAFFNRCLSLFFDVPENPHDNLVKEKSEYSVLRLKEKYKKEVMDVIKEYEGQKTVADSVRIKEDELREFGDHLRRSTAYPAFERTLKRKDPEDDILSLVTREVNKMNGYSFTQYELWNRAITWYQKYGMVSA